MVELQEVAGGYAFVHAGALHHVVYEDGLWALDGGEGLFESFNEAMNAALDNLEVDVEQQH